MAISKIDLVVGRTFLADNQETMKKLIAALVEVTDREQAGIAGELTRRWLDNDGRVEEGEALWLRDGILIGCLRFRVTSSRIRPFSAGDHSKKNKVPVKL